LRNAGVRLLFVFALLHLALFAIVLPTPANGGRYQPLVPFLFAACLLAGMFFVMTDIVDLLRAGRGGSSPWPVLTLHERKVLAVVAIVAQLGPLIPAMRRLHEAHRLAVAHTNTTEIAMGRFIATLPKGTKIASFDIGGVGFFGSRHPIVDLGGLSDPRVATMLEKGTMAAIADHLRREQVEVLVLPESDYGFEDFGVRLRIRDNPALHLEQVFIAETPLDAWRPGFAATDNSSRRQVVYRLTISDPSTSMRTPSTPTPSQPHAKRLAEEQPSFLVPKLTLLATVVMVARGHRSSSSSRNFEKLLSYPLPFSMRRRVSELAAALRES
jgi:hypothetical protein